MTITIITCTYHAETVLQRTLDSVARQTYPNVEHLIIDGCSADGTLAMAEAYRQQQATAHSRHTVKIFSEKDNGLYDAMNKGLLKATGEYLVFLNAGDMLPTAHTLQQVADAYEACRSGGREPGVLYGDTDIVDNEQRFIEHRRLAPPDKLTWRSFSKGMLVCHQAFYAQTAIARTVPYNLHYRYSADVDWCIRVMRESERLNRPLCRVHHVVVNYLAGGMSIKNHRASLAERFNVMRHHYGLATTLAMHAVFLFLPKKLR